MCSTLPHADLIVVGSGILGLATAWHAHRDGQTVHVIDSAAGPVGSSVQNFGHACFTGQSDLVQSVASRSRAGWLAAARDANFWFAESGTTIPAVTETEADVLREFAEHRGSEQVKLLSADAVADTIGNPGMNAIAGAALPQDARVNPREVAPVLARWLAAQGVKFSWNTQVRSISDGTVATNRGDFDARHVIACPGYRLAEIFPGIAQQWQVRTCSLVMSLVDRPAQIRSDMAMLSGTSLTRYDGFAAMPSVPALREELSVREPDLTACLANLMVTSTSDHLFIGDSHAYSLSPDPFIDEELARLLLDRASALLGLGAPQVRQRWLGRYADSPYTNLVLEHPDARTTVLVVTSGIGMTLSFGVAELALHGGELPGF